MIATTLWIMVGLIALGSAVLVWNAHRLHVEAWEKVARMWGRDPDELRDKYEKRRR